MKNKEIKKYHLVECNDDCELINEVNELISLGWRPIGGVSITTISAGGITPILCDQKSLLFVQAIVHHDDSPAIWPAAWLMAQ